jgi:uncharacterized cupin superfamily protein
MDKLITITPANEVTDAYKKEAKQWAKWDSKNQKSFPYNYSADELVLILDGSAELTPADGSAVITIGKGEAVTFHKGFKCKWKVTKRMKKHYTVRTEADAPEQPAITCDVCDNGCFAESYFVEALEQDICPTCFEKDKPKYAGAEHQREGETYVEQVCDDNGKPAKKRKTNK